MTRITGTPARPVLLLLACTALGVACSDEEMTGPELTEPCVSWCNTLAPWPHDGHPIQSGMFTVYSDGASREAMVELAEIAQAVLDSLRDSFGIPSPAPFVLPPGQQTIHLYAYRYHYQSSWGARAFWGGMMIFSLDHPRLAHLTERGHYTRLVTHELTHVVQNLLVGSIHSYSTYTWFEEGLAEVVSGVDAERSILTEAALDQRIAEYGAWNPIEIRNDILPDIPNVGAQYFYPMFELTMRYLLDPQGLGHSLQDARDVFMDMRSGTSFAAAFQNAFGVTVDQLQAEYFGRIRAYLP